MGAFSALDGFSRRAAGVAVKSGARLCLHCEEPLLPGEAKQLSQRKYVAHTAIGLAHEPCHEKAQAL